MNREYSDEEIVEIVKAFKLYIKKIVKHSAIDFARMSKKNKYKEILYSDLVDEKVSLSVFDDDTFLPSKGKSLKEVMENIGMTVKLSNRERKFLTLILNDYSKEEIKKYLNINEDNYFKIKSRIKIKMEKKKNG